MKRSLYVTLTVLLLVLPVALLLCGFALPPQYQETYLGEMQHKMQLLQETTGKRIIVIGGSSVPFAMDSRLINEELPEYTAVDFGLYADIGLPVMLDWARNDIHPGDLIVIMPEQDEQILSGAIGGESVWQAMDGEWRMLPLLSRKRFESLFAAFPVFAGKKLHYVLSGKPQVSGVYARSSFNEYGDMASAERTCNILSDGWLTSQQICFNPELVDEAMLEELNDFARAAREKGAEVLYHFPPMNALAVEKAHGSMDDYYGILCQRLNFAILGDPNKCVMDSGWFYDSNFHLNDSGAQVFTRLLIGDLKLYLRDTSPTDAVLPEMPASQAAMQMYHGDNKDADCFEYEQMESGCRLVKIKPQGRSAERLVLPASFEGKPVTGVQEDLLHGCTALREVVIQPNISLLPDDMFSGCSSLHTVMLTGRPSDYAVGDDWMRGASFVIRVPMEELDAYRRSYFWQKYEPWLQGCE